MTSKNEDAKMDDIKTRKRYSKKRVHPLARGSIDQEQVSFFFFFLIDKKVNILKRAAKRAT